MITRTIWKFELRPGNTDTIIELPPNAEPLSVGLDPNKKLCIWVLVNPIKEKRLVRTIFVRGTGQDCSDVHEKKFIGTVLLPPFMWHVFINW